MIEVTIKTGDEAIVRKLLQFVQEIGLEVNHSQQEDSRAQISVFSTKQTPNISWAEQPELASELFGVWKDEPRDFDQLRTKAWGGRL